MIYERKDSPIWWMHVELAQPPDKKKRPTGIRIGVTAAERKASHAEAMKVYHAAATLAGQIKAGTAPKPPVVIPTLATFVQDVYRLDLEQHRGVEREREIVARFVRDLGSKPLDAITPDLVKDWRRRRLHTAVTVAHFGGPNGKAHTFPKPGPRTVNNEVVVLKQILNAAVPQFLPVSPIRGLPNLRVVTPKRHVMTPEEEVKILRELSVIDRAIFLVGLDALVRPIDVLDLKRDDDHGATLYVADPKNGQPHEVPVSRRLRAALDAVPVDPRQPEWFFPSRRRAQSVRTRSATIAKALKAACKRAHVRYGRDGGVTLHWGTRRTGATRMIRNAKNHQTVLATVQGIGNWKTLSVLVGIYQDVSTAEKRAAVESVAPKGKAARVFALVGKGRQLRHGYAAARKSG